MRGPDITICEEHALTRVCPRKGFVHPRSACARIDRSLRNLGALMCREVTHRAAMSCVPLQAREHKRRIRAFSLAIYNENSSGWASHLASCPFSSTAFRGARPRQVCLAYMLTDQGLPRPRTDHPQKPEERRYARPVTAVRGR